MRKTAFRFIAAGGMAAALALGLTAGAAGTASAVTASSVRADATCHETSCVGHDPVIYGCSVSNTTEKGNGFAAVWGEFSNNCDAKWAQGQLTPQSLQNGYTMQVAISTNDGSEYMCVPGPSNTGMPKEFCNSYDGASSVAYTDMVDGHLAATAIVYVYNTFHHQIDQITVPI